MAIYIAPFRDEYSILEISSLKEINLYYIIYRQQEGPLGFLNDNISKLIFKNIIDGLIWYDKERGNFLTIDSDLEEQKLFWLTGLLIENDEFVIEEISMEKERLLNKSKNEILRRHGKPLINEDATFFSNFYNMDTRKYSSTLLNKLGETKSEFLLMNRSDLGVYFLIPEYSMFLQKTKDVCMKLNEEVVEVSSIDLVPAW